jgi:hypothetical protein
MTASNTTSSTDSCHVALATRAIGKVPRALGLLGAFGHAHLRGLALGSTLT